MEENKKLQIEESIVEALKTVYDPEIPVNIYDLGLIYKVDYHEEDGTLDVDMTRHRRRDLGGGQSGV